MGQAALPIVDVQAIYSDDESALRSLGKHLIEQCETWGLFPVCGHGLEPALLDAVFAAAHEFHALPLDAKMAVVVDERHFHRGYIPLPPLPAEIKPGQALPDRSTAFALMHEMAADDPAALAGGMLQAANQWPAELPELKTTALRFQQALSDLARRLLRAFAAGFDLPLDFFAPSFAKPTTFLRLVYYPPIPTDAPPELFSASAHADSGFLTLLAQDGCGGLQVRDKHGQWIAVPPQPGSLVLNVADFFARWSGDRLHSARHRVRNQSGQVRYSLPFFFDPDLDAVLDPLPASGHPAISYRRYLLDRMAAAQAAATPQGGYR